MLRESDTHACDRCVVKCVAPSSFTKNTSSGKAVFSFAQCTVRALLAANCNLGGPSVPHVVKLTSYENPPKPQNNENRTGRAELRVGTCLPARCGAADHSDHRTTLLL
eukprot:6401375-Amphidinium_carterae.1